MSSPRVIIVGDLLCDLLAKVEGDLALGTDTFTDVHTAPGGSGANAAAWLARTGVEVHFIARVGDDIFGEFLAGELKRAGVRPHLARDTSQPTGKVFVLVDGSGDRTMITDRGAGASLTPADLPAKLFEPGDHLHLSGYLFSEGSRREAAFEALRLAREAGMTLSVDPSSVPLLQDIGARHFLEWTAGADLCFPNLEEGAMLTGEQEPESIVEALLRHYSGVVLKLGPRGVLYGGANGERASAPAVPVDVVDTTGAGDALCAGFLVCWLSGRSPEEAAEEGVKLAARAVEQMGGRPGVAGRKGSLTEFLENS